VLAQLIKRFERKVPSFLYYIHLYSPMNMVDTNTKKTTQEKQYREHKRKKKTHKNINYNSYQFLSEFQIRIKKQQSFSIRICLSVGGSIFFHSSQARRLIATTILGVI